MPFGDYGDHPTIQLKADAMDVPLDIPRVEATYVGSHPKVYWFDDDIALIDCLCGESREMMIHGSSNSLGGVDACEKCGRCYRVVQYVEVVEASH